MPILLRRSNVGFLCPLGAAQQEDHHGLAGSLEIPAIARAQVDPQLEHSAADGPSIAERAEPETVDACQHRCLRGRIRNRIEPLAKRHLAGSRLVMPNRDFNDLTSL